MSTQPLLMPSVPRGSATGAAMPPVVWYAPEVMRSFCRWMYSALAEAKKPEY